MGIAPATKNTNTPSITDVSTVITPIRHQFELSSKIGKLKDLVNSLSAITFSSDEIKDIKHTYQKINEYVDIGCCTSTLLPDIEHNTKVPDFFKELANPQNRTCYSTILSSYKKISNSLLNFFLRPETISSAAPQVKTAIALILSKV